MKKLFIDVEKLTQLRELTNIPGNAGEQFIDVKLHLYGLCSGTISYGLRHKTELANLEFCDLDTAIDMVGKIRKRANMINMFADE